MLEHLENAVDLVVRAQRVAVYAGAEKVVPRLIERDLDLDGG